MKTFHALTDAGGHSIADHVDHLWRSLDGFARRLRDAVSVAVGETVSGTVQATLRAALADLVGLMPAEEESRSSRYGSSSYWGEHYDGWDENYDSYRRPPTNDLDDSDAEPAGGTTNRWPLLAFVGARLLASWLRRFPEEHRWTVAAGIGLLVALAIIAGLPSSGLLRSTMTLASLGDVLRGGVGVVSHLTS